MTKYEVMENKENTITHEGRDIKVYIRTDYDHTAGSAMINRLSLDPTPVPPIMATDCDGEDIGIIVERGDYTLYGTLKFADDAKVTLSRTECGEYCLFLAGEACGYTAQSAMDILVRGGDCRFVRA